jgi:hypothetical protein
MKIEILDENGNPVVCVICNSSKLAKPEFGILCADCIDTINQDFVSCVRVCGPISEPKDFGENDRHWNSMHQRPVAVKRVVSNFKLGKV